MVCLYDHSRCRATPTREWRSILPGQSIGVNVYDVDDECPEGEEGCEMPYEVMFLTPRPLMLTVTVFLSTGWDNRTTHTTALHPTDSPPVISTYSISDGQTGAVSLAPYYNSAGYSGRMATVSLATEGFNKVRVHGLLTDFADFYSKGVTETYVDSNGKVHDRTLTVDGTSPYVKETSFNGEDQVIVTDLTAVDDELRGFQNGFAAYDKDTDISYGFLVPFFTGESYVGKVVRVEQGQYNNSNTSAFNGWKEEYKATGGEVPNDKVKVLDLTAVDPTLRGFMAGFADETYAYFVPFFNGNTFASKLVRVNFKTFDAASVQVLDLSLADKRLAGFYGGFRSTVSAHGYLVPYKNVEGPVNGFNTEYTADGFKDNEVLSEQESIGGDHLTPNEHGLLVKINLETFALEDIEVMDLTEVDLDLKGFANGFVAGGHGYLVPYSNGFTQFYGKVTRFPLDDFSLDKVQVLDLTLHDQDLMGFVGGFAYDHYAVLVPYQNGRKDVNPRMRNQFGKVTRIDINDFTSTGIKTLDVTTCFRKNTPDFPDANLRGFNDGFVSGDFMFLLPHFNGVWFGKIVRLDLRDFDVLADRQKLGQTTDFKTGFRGVQNLDLERFDDALVGFSGYFLRTRPCPPKQFFENTRNMFMLTTGMVPKGTVFEDETKMGLEGKDGEEAEGLEGKEVGEAEEGVRGEGAGAEVISEDDV